MNISDINADEIQNNIINVKSIALKMLNKMLILIIHLNREKNIKIDLYEIFQLLYSKNKNQKLIKIAYKIMHEVSFQEFFYEKEEDFDKIDNLYLDMINQNIDNLDSSFEKDENNLSLLVDGQEKPKRVLK